MKQTAAFRSGSKLPMNLNRIPEHYTLPLAAEERVTNHRWIDTVISLLKVVSNPFLGKFQSKLV